MYARVSDWIGEAPLLRIDPVHHRMALFRRHGRVFSTSIIRWESIDDIMRSRTTSCANKTSRSLWTRPPSTSGAMFLYFDGPDG